MARGMVIPPISNGPDSPQRITVNDTSVTIDDTMPSARPWESEAYEVMSAWIRWSGLSTGARDEPAAVVRRAGHPVAHHPLVQPQPPVDELGLADVEGDQHQHHVDRGEHGEDDDRAPEGRLVVLLQGREQLVALEGQQHVQPDRHHGQQQQQGDDQDRPQALPAARERDEVHAGQPPELSAPAGAPDQQPAQQGEPDQDQDPDAQDPDRTAPPLGRPVDLLHCALPNPTPLGVAHPNAEWAGRAGVIRVTDSARTAAAPEGVVRSAGR